jgi:prolyl oligopeptidase
MKIHYFIPIALLILSGCKSKPQLTQPPLAEVKLVTEKYFGTEVKDPYRYMEDTNDSTALKWIKAESLYARNILDNISGRKELLDKMREVDKRKDVKTSDLQITDNDYYFYLKQTPGDETGKLYYRIGFTGKETLLFDPGKFGNDSSRKYTITAFYPSLDGTCIAFEVAPNGSESALLCIMDVPSQKMLTDKIDRVWGAGASWLPDGKTFLYNRLQSADVHDVNREQDSKVFLHKVGTSADKDMEFFSRAKNSQLKILPEEFPYVFYDKDSKYLFALVLTVSRNMKVYMAPFGDPEKSKFNWKAVFRDSDQVYNFATSLHDIYAYSPKDAPNFKILRLPLSNPDISRAEVFIPESKEEAITNFVVNEDGIYYSTTKNGVEAEFHRKLFRDKKESHIPIPVAAGNIYITSRGANFKDVWIYTTGWTQDYNRYRYDVNSNKFSEENLSSRASYPEFEGFMVKEVEVLSYDGQKVPLSLIYDKNIRKNGTNPVLLYGYGSYGISMTPYFSPELLLWPSMGGVLAIAHVRGGSEKGDSWYKAGQKSTKANTWKDLITCAEYLINENYTSKSKIAINGASAGGILIGRAMTERPDLFAVAIPQVGCMNALRFELDPNGPVNAYEFGTMKDSAECLSLIEMDAYLHLKDSTAYPATLITAGMNDPRVIYWQPAKFAARLMAATTSGKPVLFLTDYESGHGVGNTKTKTFEQRADVLTFAFWQTGHPEFKLKKARKAIKASVE